AIRRRVEFDPFASAVLALGLVYSGYFAETFRAGIEAIPRGNLDAGRAFGMSERLILWRITLPQVVRRMLPEALNQFVSLFKATTIVSLIAVPDLMYDVSMVTQQEMRPLPLYTGAALVYFFVIFILASGVRAFSERWRRKILALCHCERSEAIQDSAATAVALDCFVALRAPRNDESVEFLMGNWERLVWNQRDVFIAGFVVTLEVCLIAFAVAIVGGLVLC